MKRTVISFLLCLTCLTSGAQGNTYSSKITDADTGEPMPCVGVYVSAGRTTISNFDGEFSIEALPTDTIRLTFIGYETLRLRADEMPKHVEMHTTERRMAEVTVQALEKMLTRIAEKTGKVYTRTRWDKSRYFYRQTTVLSQRQEFVEAFVEARSAINLRDIHFLVGRRGALNEQQWTESLVQQSNLHHAMELAPMMFESPFWTQLFTPLALKRTIMQYNLLYDISLEELTTDGRDIYKINLKRRFSKINDKEPLIMGGTLYVDSKSLDILAFDGQVVNTKLRFQASAQQGSIAIPVTFDLHITYDYAHGHPEVANLTVQAKHENLQTRTLLFNLGKRFPDIGSRRKVKAKSNLISSIESAGYDSAYWNREEIVKQTAEERQLADSVAGQERIKVGITTTGNNGLSSIEKLAEHARLFGERIPQEKVYVQMDNTCYFLGDTIWFSAFTRRTNSGRPSKISRVLYAELWNHDGYLAERKLVEMREGRGNGFFALPDTLYSGFFELRAYTRWQLNWGQTEHPHKKITEQQFYNEDMAKDFFRDYEKLYSRVFPVYDKPKQEGEFNRDMTLRPLRRYFRSAPKAPELVLTLFPEGGNLVEGMPCRVAFEAATSEGEVKDGSLTLTPSKGEGTITAQTENRGRGSFTFTPEAGKSYEVVFTSSDGETVRQKIKGVEKEGVSLQVRREGDEWTVDIRTNLEKPLGMTIMHEGVVQRFEALNSSKCIVQSSELPVGINQVTVFDEEGRVWADRLFFVTRPELTEPTIAVLGLKDQYEPFEKIELEIKKTPTPALPHNGEGVGRGALSLAVRDAVRQDLTFDSGNIMTEMLLASEIKGFVPQPEWFFEQDDEEHRRGLDLLMMTQGWRRFAWHDMAVQGAWEITQPAEQTQKLMGSVHKYSVSPPIVKKFYGGGTYLGTLNIEGLYFDGTQNIASGNTLLVGDAKDIVKQNDGAAHGEARQNDYRSFTAGSNIIGQHEFDGMVDAQKQFQPRSLGGKRRTQTNAGSVGELKNEVRVHAEFMKPDAPAGEENAMVGDLETKDGRFTLDVPRFYGDCVFFLTAKDTTLWDKKTRALWLKKYKTHSWIQTEDDEYEHIHEDAEFYVRLNFPYTRWTKPYTFYQTNFTAYTDRNSPTQLDTDGTQLLNEVTIGARRNGRRRIDLSKPAYVIDAYEVGNWGMDAGLLTNLYFSSVLMPPAGEDEARNSYSDVGYGNTSEIANAFSISSVGDMNMDRDYETAIYWDSVRVAGASVMEPPVIGIEEQRRYSRLEYIDKMYLYTDYSPREEGSERYRQDDQPSVEVRLTRYPNWERRVTYRDRRYILHGFAYQEDFYHPDYQRNPPKEGQKDHRRTLYWNPDLRLDERGEAHVTLYNNSQRTQIQVETAGLTSEGDFLYN